MLEEAVMRVGTHVYQIRGNNAMQRPLRRSRSFKVTDFSTNRKLIYDSLLVTNTNLSPICTVSELWSNFEIFASERGVPRFSCSR